MMEKNDYYSEFKPIRNKIKRLRLLPSICELHLLLNRKPLKIIPEIVEFLYVNFIIYAEDNQGIIDEKVLFNNIIANCITLRNTITSTSIDSDVWQWLHAMALNQLKGKHNNYLDVVYRYYFIFSDERISNHIEKVLGLPYKSYLMCGIWLHSVFSFNLKCSKTKFIIPEPPEPFSKSNIQKTLQWLSVPLQTLKTELKATIKYDEDMFIMNGFPHITHPIFEENNELYCMYPDHLLTQLLSGVYYLAAIGDPVNKLSTPFGERFEHYVGEILSKNNTTRNWPIHDETIYNLAGKGGEKKSSDWIIETTTAIVFIECKTKRLNINAKKSQANDMLDSDIKEMAKGITQLYKVYNDYCNNLIPGLTFNSEKTFIPILVTLEEWFAGGPNTSEKLTLLISELLIRNNLSIDLIDKYKFKTYSIDRFEMDVQLMFHYGFEEYFKLLSSGQMLELQESFKFNLYFEQEYNDLLRSAVPQNI